MKKILVLLVAVFAMGTFNVFATNNETTTSTQAEADNSFYTCQFSLNHYSGGVWNSYTNNVVVYLNCPQKEDVTATVYVYVDGKRVASALFTIKAGEKASKESSIFVGREYNDKKYTLEV